MPTSLAFVHYQKEQAFKAQDMFIMLACVRFIYKESESTIRQMLFASNATIPFRSQLGMLGEKIKQQCKKSVWTSSVS